jgi:hypothetical protein
VQAKAEAPYAGSVFIDTYSASWRNQIKTGTRPYTTQAIKDKDYHLNLGSCGINYDDGSVIATLTGQYGTSVDANYNQEPHEAFKYIQESYVGAHLDGDTTIEAGIFLSHLGGEGWLSKDNLTYTRSYVAEFSPYYESGLRLSQSLTKDLDVQILAVNGWQNISDNRHPAFGGLVSYTIDDWTLSATNFVGSEDYGTRVFHNLGIKGSINQGLSVQGLLDFGHQSSRSAQSGMWWGASVMAKQRVHRAAFISGRVESYQDPAGIIVASVTNQDFQAYSSSLGLDINLGRGFTIRNELKVFWSPDKIFLNGETPRDNDLLFVASLSFAGEQGF